MKTIIFKQRKDNKFKVRYLYEHTDRVFNKIQTAEAIAEHIAHSHSDWINHTGFNFDALITRYREKYSHE